jgi:hypothetical protein
MSDVKISAAEQEAATDTILEIDLKGQAQKGPDLRQVHAKSHGLVWGEFIVENNIPETLKVGVFVQPKTYPLWARFSNASDPEKRGKLKSDHEPDLRGLAIKLLNVEGKKVLDDEQETQDFILLNLPTFIVRDVQGFANLTKAGIGQASPEELQSLAPTFEILKEATSKQVANPLLIQYWSTTPFKLGSHVIKFSVKPHQQEDIPTSLPSSDNFLRESIFNFLTEDKQEAKFDFLVQLYVDDEKTPIEDAMQEWKEEDSPFIKLATLRIPAQKFDFEERKRLDEGLSFSPWHTLPEHEPIGSINLARKKIYQEIAKFRRDHIEERLREPQPYTVIRDEPH